MSNRAYFLLFASFVATVVFLILRYTNNPYAGFEIGKVATHDFVVLKDSEVVLDEQTHNLLQGQILVRQGDIIPILQGRIMEALRDREQTDFWMGASGSVLLGLFLLTMFAIFLQRINPDIWRDSAVVNLVAIFYWVCLGLMMLAHTLPSNHLTFLLNPVPMLVLLFAVFINSELALLMAMIFATLFGFSAPLEISTGVFFVSLLASMLGIFSVSSRKSRRGDITRAGLLVGVGSFLLLLGLNLTHINQLPSISFETIYMDPLMGAINGVLSAIIALGAIPIIESLFSIPTSTRLLELLELNQPLLQKLMAEAPGTYHHSLIVANLAEKAAEEIGADALFCRCASLYHDIGKMKRPFFFIENQMGGVNLHDNLNPSLSVLIITSHTHDGVEIGKEYNLPKPILDIMIQHHGTDLVAFFHNKAKMNESEDDLVQEHQYRYDGTKPQSKEAGIIMIADSVEAASRTLLKPNHNSIESLIRRIIDAKDQDGQFDECDLTKKDLEMIANSLNKSLLSMYHARIDYPEDLLKKNKGMKVELAMKSVPNV